MNLQYKTILNICTLWKIDLKKAAKLTRISIYKWSSFFKPESFLQEILAILILEKIRESGDCKWAVEGNDDILKRKFFTKKITFERCDHKNAFNCQYSFLWISLRVSTC